MNKLKTRLIYPLIMAAFGAFFCSCAANVAPTSLYASYAKGRVSFTQNVPPLPGVPIIVEYSTNGFATVEGRTSISNDVGLLTFPFQIDFDVVRGNYLQFRAYLDVAGSQSYAEGEGFGRFDGMDGGNANYLWVNRAVGLVCPPGYSWDPTNKTDKPCGPSIFASSDDTTADNDVHFIDGVSIVLDAASEN